MRHTPPHPPPFWGRSVAWLLLLGPLFFLSYGFSNNLAAAKAVDHSIVFAWERHIPFLPWTIVPYWSIDLLYGLSFLLARTRLEVDRHALRLLTAQIISVACFIAFPLHFAFERPPVDGFFGALFDALMDFDKPYNQAPSLHISLLVIIWARFRASVPQAWRITVNVWALLIGLSVLTTYQHHFIDVPTGVLVGLFCVWLWPSSGASPLSQPASTTPQQRKLALYYLLGALILAAGALAIGGFALWLLWASASLALVALIYAGIGAERGFQKCSGQHNLAITLLFAPYLLGAWINSRLWTREQPKPDEIADGVWLGRLPSANEIRQSGFAALLDLTAELIAPSGNWRYANLPWLTRVAPQTLWMNPLDAQERGLKHGDMVKVFNDRGATLVPVKVTPRIMPGVVSLPQGAWHKARADGVDTAGSVNMLTKIHSSPLAKGNPQHTNLVQVAKA